MARDFALDLPAFFARRAGVAAFLADAFLADDFFAFFAVLAAGLVAFFAPRCGVRLAAFALFAAFFAALPFAFFAI